MYLKKELYELIKSDERIFDFIHEDSLDGLWCKDLENPENEWINAKFWRVLGYNPEEMPHKTSAWQSIINQEDLKLVNENLAKHCEDPNHPYDQVVRYTHKDGTTKWIRCRGIAIRDVRGKPIRMFGTHQDVTGIKNSEIALFETKKIAEESEEKYCTIFENINDAVFIHKILHTGEPGKYLYFNNAAIHLLGYTSEEFKAMSPRELDDPQCSRKYIPMVMKELLEKRKSKFDAVQIAKDGRKIDVEVNAVLTKIGDDDHIISVCRDITEKKASQKILAEKEQFLSAIYKGVNHSVFVVDILENGDFQYAGINPHHEMVTGISTEFIKGKRPEEVLPDEAAKNVRSRYAESIIQKQAITYEEWLPFRGKNICWETTLYPQIDESGNVYQIIGTSHEITKRKLTEQLLQDKSEEITVQNEELNQVNKALVAAKEKAEESEKLFKSVIENAPDGVVIINEQGSFKYVSPNAERIFGYNTHESVGHSGDEFTHPDDLPLVLKTMEAIVADPSQKPKLEYRFKRKNGEFRWIETTFTNLLSDKIINGIVLNFTDITARKQIFDELLIAKEEAEESERRFRNAIENSPIPTAIAGVDEALIFVNKQFTQTYGYTIQDIPLIEKWYELAYPDPDYRKSTVEDWNKQVQQSFENGVPTKVREYQITCKNGEMKTVAVSGYFEKDLIVGLFQDITERKKAEEDLRKSEERYALAIDASEQGIWDWNVETNEIFYSEQWKRQIGYEDHEIINEFDTWEEHLHPDEKLACQAAVHAYLNAPIGNFLLEFRFRHKDGSYRWIHNKASSIINNEGKVVRMFGTHSDITERKQAEELLLEKNEEIAAKNKEMASQNEELIQVNLELIAAKQKTEESEERFNLAMKASNDGLFDWNLETNEIYYSPAWKKMLGYEEHELPNDFSVWEKTTDPEDVKKSWELQQKVITRQIDRFVIEFKMKHKAGHWIDVLAKAEAVFNEKGKAVRIVGTHTDITERKNTEKQIRLNEMHLSSLVENPAGYIVYRTWLNRNTGQIEVIKVSPNFTELLGIPETAKEIFQYWFANIHPDDLPLLVKASEEGMKPPFTLQIEIRNNHPKRGLQWFQVKAVGIPYADNPEMIEYANGIILDITERKKAESLLKDSEQRFRSLVNTINSGVAFYKVINDGKSGSDYFIQSFNEFALKHENLKEEDVVGKSLKDIRPEIDEYGLIDTFHQVFKTGNPALFPAKLYIDEKYSNYYENRVFKISTGEIVAVYDDVTERERANLALKDALEKAQESDRLKSAFLANMSHEIRTPMNGILGFADLLKKPDLTGDQQQKYIGIIEKSGARMLNIINDIVDISKIEAGLMELHLQEANVNEQVDYTYTFFKHEAEAKGIKLSFSTSLTNKEAVIQTDREKVYAILTNLVKNALKYTMEGAIEFGCRKSETGHAEMLQFYVKDTGIGIPKEKLEGIFERFMQADIDDKMARQGAGLGLAISKAYIEMLGGKIWVESEVGLGSTFYFNLPYITGTKNEAVESSIQLSEKDESIRKLKILIAEDDEVSEMLIDNYIKIFGKEILKAKTGIEAVEIFRANPDIDLILMDICMPGLGGYEATKQIREFNYEIVIIAQTAYGLSGDREKAINAGCNDYIAKPIKKTELQEMIQKYFGNEYKK